MAENQRQTQAEILDRGNIYFAYRPKVKEKEDEPSATGFADVQRSYMILSPHGKDRYRLIVIGQKQLPEIDQKSKNWGFVDKVAREPKDIEQALRGDTYQTKTRGERVSPAARPAGEGVYAIVRRDDHTRLVYVLELPDSPGTVQRALNIEEEGSYVLSVKNPQQSSPRQADMGKERKADFPKHLQERFKGRRFGPADPPEFLDYEGAELLLVGAAEDISEELGIRLDPQQETDTI